MADLLPQAQATRLPYDYARCEGVFIQYSTGDRLADCCHHCKRRTCSYGAIDQYSWIGGLMFYPDGTCPERIAP